MRVKNLYFTTFTGMAFFRAVRRVGKWHFIGSRQIKCAIQRWRHVHSPWNILRIGKV